jgi:ABC-type dipeptide/oligopeptide/nickel transport system permease subunit
MTALVIALVVVLMLTGVGGWIGMRVMAFLKARVDELLPDRMVDYCGYIPTVETRD